MENGRKEEKRKTCDEEVERISVNFEKKRKRKSNNKQRRDHMESRDENMDMVVAYQA